MRLDVAAVRCASDIWALVMFLLILWLGVVLALYGVLTLSGWGAVALGGAGTLLVLGAGFAWTLRLQRR